MGHEAGHRVFDHHSAEVMHDELAGLLGLNVELVRHVLGRQSYSQPEEEEAEVFGTLVVERVARDAPPAPRPRPRTHAAWIVGQLESVLEAPPPPKRT